MQDFIMVTGMVLSQTPVGEYDRRVCILTKERGKISAFAKGARRPGSRFMAATGPFSFGQFKLYEGKSAYNVAEVTISQYFEELRADYIGAYYGMYFLEIADYYTRENNDEREMLKLLYQSMRALLAPSLPNKLVKCIYELKTLVVNGEYPGVPADRELNESTIYALRFIEGASVERLYTFLVKEEVLGELDCVAAYYRRRFMDRQFKSLEILESLC
ncbi:MAG: DNA repair protein RecO [Lachnospiraceae bacterium]|nr:DNA repair protein RecO [Lachnospiraceae bacterium]MDE6128273.1 DNA repair protein RecO [Lachnospiraceae bacterium]